MNCKDLLIRINSVNKREEVVCEESYSIIIVYDKENALSEPITGR